MQRINALGLDIIKNHEKCVLRAYQDPRGRWTIGWGHTGGVQEGDFWSQEEADAALVLDVASAERTVASYVYRDLNENQFSALVSFVFNEGSGTFYKSSILVYLNHNQFEEACVAMALYNIMHVDGVRVVSTELIRRRADEQALFRRPLEFSIA